MKIIHFKVINDNDNSIKNNNNVNKTEKQQTDQLNSDF